MMLCGCQGRGRTACLLGSGGFWSLLTLLLPRRATRGRCCSQAAMRGSLYHYCLGEQPGKDSMPFVFGKPSKPGDAAVVRRVSPWMRPSPSGAVARWSNPSALLSRSSPETAWRQPDAPTAAAWRNSWSLLPPQRDGAARHCQCGSTALWSGPTRLPRPTGGEDWSRCYVLNIITEILP